MASVPDVFIWTKIGDDGGEVLLDSRNLRGGILGRKDAERRAESFWWGVGSSLNRDRLHQAIENSGRKLLVIFSKQLSPQKKCESDKTAKMALWTRYIDRQGKEHDIPDHAMVVGSSKYRKNGKPYPYYSLVCQSNESILHLREPLFNETLFCNVSKNGKQPGDSQNTALLTGDLQADQKGGRYHQSFCATLVEPWFVTLSGRRELKPPEQDLIAEWDGRDYASLVRQIRRQCGT